MHFHLRLDTNYQLYLQYLLADRQLLEAINLTLRKRSLA